jgi:hypothetical protein
LLLLGDIKYPAVLYFGIKDGRNIHSRCLDTPCQGDRCPSAGEADPVIRDLNNRRFPWKEDLVAADTVKVVIKSEGNRRIVSLS